MPLPLVLRTAGVWNTSSVYAYGDMVISPTNSLSYANGSPTYEAIVGGSDPESGLNPAWFVVPTGSPSTGVATIAAGYGVTVTGTTAVTVALGPISTTYTGVPLIPAGPYFVYNIPNTSITNTSKVEATLTGGNTDDCYNCWLVHTQNVAGVGLQVLFAGNPSILPSGFQFTVTIFSYT